MTPRKQAYRKKSRYVFTEAHLQHMREASQKRWRDKSQREHLSKLRTLPLPVDKIRMLYEEGFSMRKIADLLGTNPDTICRRMKKCGITARRKGTAGHHWNDRHHNWKGDQAAYTALHQRLNRRKGTPKYCEACGSTDPTKRYDWANMTGHYEDPTDYKRMCRSCHKKLDLGRRGSR